MGHTQYKVVVVAMDWADLDLGSLPRQVGRNCGYLPSLSNIPKLLQPNPRPWPSQPPCAYYISYHIATQVKKVAHHLPWKTKAMTLHIQDLSRRWPDS